MRRDTYFLLYYCTHSSPLTLLPFVFLLGVIDAKEDLFSEVQVLRKEVSLFALRTKERSLVFGARKWKKFHSWSCFLIRLWRGLSGGHGIVSMEERGVLHLDV